MPLVRNSLIEFHDKHPSGVNNHDVLALEEPQNTSVRPVYHRKGHDPIKLSVTFGRQTIALYPIVVNAYPLSPSMAIFLRRGHILADPIHRWDLIQSQRSIYIHDITLALLSAAYGRIHCQHDPARNIIVDFMDPIEKEIREGNNVLRGNYHVRLGK